MANLPLIVVRHPLADLSSAEIAEVANQCHPRVAAALSEEDDNSTSVQPVTRSQEEN